MAKNEKLSALMSNVKNIKKSNDIYQRIPLDKIETDPNQPRKEFEPEALKELSESISRYGVMQPIIVAKIDDDKYIIRQGERRYRASLLAHKKDIPALIDTDNTNVLEKQLVENIARENLSVSEIAESIRYLIDDKNLKQKDLALALAKSKAFVSNYYAFASFKHPLKEQILTKTQDLIIITDFKRLLEDADEDKYIAITHFLNSKSSINREDMAILKIKLEKLYDNNDLDMLQTASEFIKEDDVNTVVYPKEPVTPKKTTADTTEEMTKTNSTDTTVKIELSLIIDFLKTILPADISKSAIKKIKKKFGE